MTTTRALIDWLRSEIYAGRLAPGTRLRQIDLASRFGVSTTPVREALSALRAEGLVNADPHRGAVVFMPSADDFLESFEIRQALEMLALEHAIPRIDDDRYALLQEFIVDMRRAVDYSQWSALNEVFHRMLYASSGKRRLCELIETMRLSSRYYIHLAVSQSLSTSNADAEHQRILDACRSGDVALATAELHSHIDVTAQHVLRLFAAGGGVLEEAQARVAGPSRLPLNPG